MRTEIITIGDELLNGMRVDTNSAFLADRLDSIGLTVTFKSSVGDDLDRMAEAFHLALSRSEIIVVTGGLGPTDDDMTKKGICKVFKRNLIFHEEVLEQMNQRFEKRGLTMPPINQNQALLPQGAKFLDNRLGTALGIVITDRNRLFCAMPGVPMEMREMTDRELIPLLKQKVGNRVSIRRVIRTTGAIESAIAEKIRPVLKFAEGVSLAYLPSYRGVDLVVKGRGTIAEEVQAGVDILADRIVKLLDDVIYTEGEIEPEEVVGKLLRAKGKTLAVAESCTGGMLGEMITSVAGSSDYFLGGIIAYDNKIKINHLGVAATTIERFGAVSAECAKEMAQGVVRMLGADLGVSITGLAGPGGGTDEKPVGTVFIGLATTQRAVHKKLNLGSERGINRQRSTAAALEMIRQALIGN